MSTYRVQATLLVEAESADEALLIVSEHFARLAENSWSDLVLPGSEVATDEVEDDARLTGQ